MSDDQSESEVKPKPKATKPKATKPKTTKPKATKPKTTKPKAIKPKAKVKDGPKGYGTHDVKLARAIAIIRKEYPSLTQADATAHLAGVGAGRFLALHTYSTK